MDTAETNFLFGIEVWYLRQEILENAKLIIGVGTAEELTIEERISEIERLTKWFINIQSELEHVFYPYLTVQGFDKKFPRKWDTPDEMNTSGE